MFSPTAGPSSSRTSPSERKWLPRTSTRATFSRSLAITFAYAAHSADAQVTSSAAEQLQRQHRAGGDAAARPARLHAVLRARRNGVSSSTGWRSARSPTSRPPGWEARASAAHASRGLQTLTSSSRSTPASRSTRSRTRSSSSSTSPRRRLGVVHDEVGVAGRDHGAPHGACPSGPSSSMSRPAVAARGVLEDAAGVAPAGLALRALPRESSRVSRSSASGSSALQLHGDRRHRRALGDRRAAIVEAPALRAAPGARRSRRRPRSRSSRR